jgi:hypothetical protein
MLSAFLKIWWADFCVVAGSSQNLFAWKLQDRRKYLSSAVRSPGEFAYYAPPSLLRRASESVPARSEMCAQKDTFFCLTQKDFVRCG